MSGWIKHIKSNNDGSTLILVLICMTFLGLLGSVVLMATVSNMKMKSVDSLTKDNFYTTESAVDELKIGLEETAEQCMKEAYSYMLQRYSTTPDSERTLLLRRKFINLFFEDLTGNNTIDDIHITSPIVVDLKKRYLISDTAKYASVVSGGGVTVTKNLEDLTLTINGISIGYTDQSGYESTITTDIIISATYPSLSTRNANNEGVYFTDYALIADEIISSTEAQTSTINGNVYGGKGIHAYNGASLVFDSNKIISRESLKAMDKSRITINGQTEAGVVNNSIWVNNIETISGKDTSDNLYFDIVANCYVKDDLTLGANNGHVKIKGNYYGYQVGDETGTPAGSSSIVINAKNAVLDLEGVDKLWIAGRSFISVSDYNLGDEKEKGILQGDSISFKGNQIAYLMPGKCIEGIGHNPMTSDEYIEFSNLGKKINLDNYTGIKLRDYVASEPFIECHVPFVTGNTTNTMVYLYLNFGSAELASSYFNKYRQDTNNLNYLNSIAQGTNLGSVKLPQLAEEVVYSGMAFSYDPSITTPTLNYLEGGKYIGDIKTEEIQLGELENAQLNFSNMFLRLTNYLIDDPISGDSNKLVKNIIRYENDTTKNILGIESYPEDIVNQKIDNTFILITGKEDPLILDTNYSGKSGLIITNGDIVLENCIFNGLIITTKNIKLGATSTVNADPEYVKSIIDTNPEVNQFFYNYTESDAKADGDKNSTVEITYKNWYKQ